MKDSLKPGLRATLTMRVAPEMLVPRLAGLFANFGDMPEVLATMAMVGFVESACLKCVSGHLDASEHSVGIHVDVSHVAATPVGMQVRAEVELVAVEGRRLTFAVKVFDEGGLVGEGRHQRAVIAVARFRERVQAKADGARPAAS
ncbi:MAG: thioesterase family protein [Roseiarcus sp.]|jgi:fluoroacetyl-CoA thioesterase|uniref:thioesterase family protein n=1 Tax=Roseiarcus sp. TaxID=1969460 RepID=UPI003C13DAEF